jgi:predicted nucleic acid-binding protein
MDVEVVDASALAALLFGEPDADVVAERLGDAALLSPSLVRYELASVYLKKVRRYPDQQAGLIAALELYPRLGVVEAEVPAAELARVAERAGVTAYDAAYLWVAGHVGAPLLTLDQELARTAPRFGISLVT